MAEAAFVAVLMGSRGDLSLAQEAIKVFDALDVRYEVRVRSAHRSPDATREYVVDAEARGCAVFIAFAGLAAHLAGAVAAHTVRPVIGVPVAAGSLSGFDALLSTVQMPAGVPVATVAVGTAGARNAAHLAAQILAIGDAGLAGRLSAARETMRESLERDDAEVRAKPLD